MLRQGTRTSSIFNTHWQHVAKRQNKVAKRKQHVAPYKVAIVWPGLAVKYWANNVETFCVELLRSFGRGLIFRRDASIYQHVKKTHCDKYFIKLACFGPY